MPDQLSHDMRQNVEDWCRRIVAGCDDGEVFEELYGHVEDNILAFMNGEAALSAEDAFLLVREHFGDTSRVRGMLGEVDTVGRVRFGAFRLALVSAAIVVVSFILMIPVSEFLIDTLSSAFNVSGSLTEPRVLIVASGREQINLATTLAVLVALPALFFLYQWHRSPALRTAGILRPLGWALSVSVVFVVAVSICGIAMFPLQRYLLARYAPLSVGAMMMRAETCLYAALIVGMIATVPWIMIVMQRAGAFFPWAGKVSRSTKLIVACIIGAVLTPPDPLSMIIFAGAIFIVLNSDLVIGRFFQTAPSSYILKTSK